MPETNATQQNQGGQQLTSPKEETIKDRKAEDKKALIFRFRLIRWILFAIMTFCLGVIFIMPKISSHESRISLFWIWTLLIFSIAGWYTSHCLKFIRAWENAVVFRFGEIFTRKVIKKDKNGKKVEETERAREPGPRWIWYFLDKIVFVRMDQQEGKPLELSLLCGSRGKKLEVTVKTFFVYKVKDAASFLVNASKGIELLTGMIEAGVGSIIGGNEFEILVEERDVFTNRLKKIINNRISNPDEASDVTDSDFTFTDKTKKEEFSKVLPASENREKEWGLEVLQIRMKDIDPRPDVLETMQGVIKAENQAQAEVEKAEGQVKVRKMLAEVKKFELEQEGEGAGVLYGKQADALNKPGGEKVTAIEVSKTVKSGDKIIYTDDGVKGITGALAEMFTGRKLDR
jgi:regulator of protease activity HflC (stomatin/prohibitin superfamily)